MSVNTLGLSPEALDALIAEVTAEIKAEQEASWPETVYGYFNRMTGKYYQPHNAEELAWLQDETSRYPAVIGGEGSGKSVAGVIKDLERLKRGMRGILVSPDLPHFKKSLWQEFRSWCPPQVVSPRHRYRLEQTWEPNQIFMLSFVGGGFLICGGIDNPISWEGPNVHFAHIDEARRSETALPIKTLDGRVRLSGPNGEMPQLWITSTPKKHWMFDLYGPLKLDKDGNPDDEFANFKADVNILRLRTLDNEANTFVGYAQKRGQSLTAAEARVLLDAEWEDPGDSSRFLSSIGLWDACREDLPVLTGRTALVAAADAGVVNDSFGFVAVSRHPGADRREDIAIRHVMEWVPPKNGAIDFEEVEEYIYQFCKQHAVVQLVYDPHQLHHMMQRLERRMTTFCEPFQQGDKRLLADKQYWDLIVARRVAHDGDERLRAHMDNANRKLGPSADRIRIVKRQDNLKIDLAVATSMAAFTALELNL